MKKLALLMIIGTMMFAFSGVQKANAVAVGEPGEALLVPYVLYSSTDSINTLIGITVPGMLGADSSPILAAATAGGLPFATAAGTSAPGGVAAVGLNPFGAAAPAPSIHWFFFDDTSTHILDNTIPATADDFVPFDWGAVVVGAGAQALCDNVTGYLVFSDVAATTGVAAGFAMFGDAAMVQGNWQSAAYIPVIPMADGADGAALAAGADEVIYAAGVPANVSPLSAGIPMDDDSGAAGDIAGQHMDMRYFLDPALNGGTKLVVWFDRNCPGGVACCDRTALPIEVYATDETHGSAVIDLSKELNVVNASTLPWTSHTETDMNGGPLTDQGFVWFTIPELPTACGNDDTTNAGPAGPDSAAVAFSLMFFGTSTNALQVQTALAHERGLW